LLTYAWTQTAGTPVELSDASSATPSFTAPGTAGALTFSLVVTDPSNPTAGNGTNGKDSTASTVTVTVTGLPVADAGPDQSGVVVGDVVTLDGSASTAPEGGSLTYSWSQTGGPAVVLSDPSSVSPSFTAPGGPDTLTFELTVSDGTHTDTDSVEVDVANSAPVADAGPAQSVTSGDVVTLDASGSTDPDGQTLTYSWSQTDGDPVVLSDPTDPQPTFTAPDGDGTLVFEVTVDDGTATSTASVTITVNAAPNQAPTAILDVNPTGGQAPLEVTFDGTASSDLDGTIASYAWDFGDGGTSTDPSGTYTYTAAGSFTVTLVVTDDRGATDTATTTVEVAEGTPTNQPPTAVASVLPTSGTAPLEVVANGSGSTDPDGTIVSYAWDFGDGATSDLFVASHTYTSQGSYLVTLTVTDDDGATASDSVTVVVDPPEVEHDRVKLQFGGYLHYLADSPTSGGDLKVTRDGAGIVSVTGTATYPSAVVGGGTATIKVNLTRVISGVNSYNGTLTVDDRAAGIRNVTSQMLLQPIYRASSTAVKGTINWYVPGAFPNYFLNYVMTFTIDDRT
jgi:PKD repeat protein